MKRLISLVAALVVLAAPSAFAEKNYVTKTLAVDNFTSVECGITCEIEYSNGAPSFVVYGDEKIVAHVTNMVRNGVLTIGMDKNKIYGKDDLKVRISCPVLKEVTINGVIEFENESAISFDKIKFDVNGASKLDIKNVKAGTMVVNANGTGGVDIEKIVCDNLTVNINGAGGGDIEGLECGKLAVAVNGAGGCDVEGHAKEADLKINGVGGIGIKKFEADKLTTAVNGIGKISKD